jgi:pyruvate ferredoxin oxidoreductase gamma subunit/2-oxoisovalerate ferredoxin oxidoreductase gamma subunit
MAAAEVLATALWSQGKFVQAFPSFQPEKKGAPTAAFIRYDNEEIWLRCEVDRADLVVVLDRAAILSMDIPHRLLPGGLLISNGSATDLPSRTTTGYRAATVNATQIAIHHKLGTRLMPQVNMLMLGAFARLSEDMSLTALENAIVNSAAEMTNELRLAVREVYEHVSEVVT